MVGFLIEHDRLEELEVMGVKDSKKLTPGKREELAEKLQEMGEVFVKVIEPHQIDAFNLNRLEMMAVRDIVARARPDRAVIDAFEKRLEEKLGLDIEVVAEHRADENHVVVGAASIVAKVLRDREIARLREEHGDFGSGYPGDPKTAEFIARLVRSKERLPPFVRRSWDTVKRLQEAESQAKLSGFFK